MNGSSDRPAASAPSKSRGRSSYFSESRYSSLPSRDGLALEQLVAGIHAPGRTHRRRQHRADREHARPAVLQALVQDVGGVDEQVGPPVVGDVGDLLAEFGQLPLRRAPGEVGVRLGEAQFGQTVQAGRAGERLGQEQHVGVGVLGLGDQPGPEVGRLGVRVVDPKNLDAVIHPEPHHAQHFVVEAGRVVVEVDRVDVLVLLRRVLGVGDGAVGQFGEPLAVILGPRVVRRALQRQVERDLHAQVLVRRRRSRRSRRSCRAAGARRRGRPRRCRSPTVSRRPGRGRRTVVAALAVHLADRVDRRQVHDVEAHLRDARQGRRGGGEGAVHRVALAVPAAGRAGEHLVPGAEPGQRTVHPDAVLLAAGDQLAQRILGRGARRPRRPARAPRGSPDRRARAVRPRPRAAVRGWRGDAGGGALQQLRADQQVVGQFALALAGVQFGRRRSCRQVCDRVAPAVDPEGPQARRGRG